MAEKLNPSTTVAVPELSPGGFFLAVDGVLTGLFFSFSFSFSGLFFIVGDGGFGCGNVHFGCHFGTVGIWRNDVYWKRVILLNDISMKDFSTKDISTKDISTKDISTKDISTKDISTKDI
jgi:hypothetical protein